MTRRQALISIVLVALAASGASLGLGNEPGPEGVEQVFHLLDRSREHLVSRLYVEAFGALDAAHEAAMTMPESPRLLEAVAAETGLATAHIVGTRNWAAFAAILDAGTLSPDLKLVLVDELRESLLRE